MDQRYLLLRKVFSNLHCQFQPNRSTANEQNLGRLLDLGLYFLESLDSSCLGVVVVQVAGFGVTGTCSIDEVLVLDAGPESFDRPVNLHMSLGDVGREGLDDLALLGRVVELGVGYKELILPAINDTGTGEGKHVMEMGVLLDDDHTVS